MSSDASTTRWPMIIAALVAGENLSDEMVAEAMGSILGGDATPAQMAAFMVGLRAKGETAAELRVMLASVRRASLDVPARGDALVDVVGTGGDASHSVNISTMAAIVAAGAGARVCKHGNRAASSRCGAADVLEALGVAIDLDGPAVARCLEEAGIGFCFAPRFHPGFRHVGPVRRELGIPTAFNLLGPMANPAPVTRMVVGVADPRVMEPMAEALISRGIERGWVVHGHGGLDELVLSGANEVVEIGAGETRRFVVDAAEHGFARWPTSDLRGGDPADNAAVARRVLGGEPGAVRDVVVFNAAAVLMLVGSCETIEAGRALADTSIDSGAAASALERLVTASNLK